MKQIIALGGGGFSMEPENPLLDNYILQSAKTKKPKICFLPTASGDSQNYIERFYKCFDKKECEPKHLSLFKIPTTDLEDYILTSDIVYVGGGSTTNMLLIWKHWGVDNYLKKAYQNETILTGLSAGSICWFEEGVSEVIDNLEIPSLKRHAIVKGLGFLSSSHCPHFDGEEYRKPIYEKWILKNEIKSGYGVDDGVGLHFDDGKFKRAISSRPNGRCYFLSKGKSNDLLSTEIIPNYLGHIRKK